MRIDRIVKAAIVVAFVAQLLLLFVTLGRNDPAVPWDDDSLLYRAVFNVDWDNLPPLGHLDGLERRQGEEVVVRRWAEERNPDAFTSKDGNRVQENLELLLKEMESSVAVKAMAPYTQYGRVVDQTRTPSVDTTTVIAPSTRIPPAGPRPGVSLLEGDVLPDHRISCEAEDPLLIFYNRIGKAGSTTLHTWMKRSASMESVRTIFGRDPEYLNHNGRAIQNEVDAVLKNTHPDKRTIYVNHIYFLDFPQYTSSPKVSDIAYVNMLRHPGERYVSQYWFWRGLNDLFGRECREFGITVEECIRRTAEQGEVYTCPIFNYQTLYLCGQGPECVIPATTDTYKTARKHVLERYSTIGVLEELELYTKVLRKKFPSYFTIEVDTGHSMKTKGSRTREQEVIDLAAEYNHFDMLLYELVVELLHAQAYNCGDYP